MLAAAVRARERREGEEREGRWGRGRRKVASPGWTVTAARRSTADSPGGCRRVVCGGWVVRAFVVGGAVDGNRTAAAACDIQSTHTHTHGVLSLCDSSESARPWPLVCFLF